MECWEGYLLYMKVLVTKSCPTLWDPMDCSPQGFSVHGISQARILQWVAISFTRGSSWPRDQTCISSWQVDSLPLSHLGSPIKKSQIRNASKGVEEKEPSYTVTGNVNWSPHCGEQYGGFLKKLKLPYNPAIPFLGIYLERTKTLIWKDTCTSNVHSSTTYNSQDLEAT